jgi:uncharacterized protein YjiS (DUF1127 family)
MRFTRAKPENSTAWQPATPVAATNVIHAVRELPEVILRWQDRLDQRRQLAGMSDRLLKDIGVSNADAARETAKPFWRS